MTEEAVPKRKKMRKVPYTKELGEEVCNAVMVSGTIRRADIREELPKGVNRWHVYYWKRAVPEFKEMIDEARKIGVDDLFEEALDIAFTKEGDMKGLTKSGAPWIDYECVNRSKLKIDTIYRMIGRVDPQAYAESFYKPVDRKIRVPKADSNTVSARIDAVYKGIEHGRITPEEGNKLAAILTVQARAVENAEIMKEIETVKDLVKNVKK